MALSEDEKRNLDRLREDLVSASGPLLDELEKEINEMDLSGISAEDLKALTNPIFTNGVDFSAIDTTHPFSTTEMNQIAPGAIDVRELKTKLANQSYLSGRTTDVIETQSGTMAVTSEIKQNVDVEDLIKQKTESQGTNLKLIYEATAVDGEATKNQEIQSKFVEENVE